MPSKVQILINFIICLIAIPAMGQMTFQIILQDSISKTAIQYATIGLKKANTGGTSDENGQYSLETADTQDTLIFSCLGFQPKNIPVVLLKQGTDNTFFLRPIVYDIPEVAVQPKKLKRTLDLNSLDKKAYPTSFISSGFTQQIVRFFPAPSEPGNYYLGQFSMLLDQGKSASFRVRVYAQKTNAKGPGEDLLREQVIIVPGTNTPVIDLSKYKISIPDDGFFIGFEWLKTKKNVMVSKIQKETAYTYKPFIKHLLIDPPVQKPTGWNLNYRGQWNAVPFSFAIAVQLMEME